MKNMKIEINEQQPLEDVVRELERLGYKKVTIVGQENGSNIYACGYKMEFYRDGRDLLFYGLTTLAELKEM